MADENTATAPASDTADLSPKAVEAIAPVTKADGESSVPAAEITPAASSTDTRKHEDLSEAPHPHFRWHADVLVDGRDVYQGFVKDISMKGVNLILDHNLQNAKFVKLHIHIPPLDVAEPHRVLEVSGKITATVYDNDEESFRSGISFLEFALESDRAYLQSRLSVY